MEQNLTAGMNSLWAAHFEAQLQRVAVQEQAFVALVGGALDETALAAAQHAAHTLAGSLGTFGLDEGSRLAVQLEDTWRAESIDHAQVAELAQRIAAMRALLESRRPSADSSADPAVPSTADPAADIWLVDDDELFAKYVMAPLQRRYRVAWLSSGESALAEVARTDADEYPKLILLDIEMPGIKGLSVLEQLADQGVAGRAAIVMLTRRSVVEDVVRARQLGAFDFLAKPISVSTLTERVGRALQTVR
jgi:CheY-like chemotaxis protein